MPRGWKVRPLGGLRRWLCGRLRDESTEHHAASAIVFAPHQDDESLGCGGTILVKRAAGAPVTLVFMTDGSSSHSRFMDSAELKAIRNQEARQAAEELGLAADDVRFFDFPDGWLSEHHAAAVERTVAVLEEYRPQEVYVPYREDGTADHEATFRIVADAVAKSGLAVRVCEYPVWFWNHWPWVPLQIGWRREARGQFLRALRFGFGFHAWKQFRSGVFVGHVLGRKRRALEFHKSQMSVLRERVGWPTLADVSGGEFLRCFFEEVEVFHCWDSVPQPGPRGAAGGPQSRP